jgi:hypothetical protein
VDGYGRQSRALTKVSVVEKCSTSWLLTWCIASLQSDEDSMEEIFEFEAESMQLYEQIMAFRIQYRR